MDWKKIKTEYIAGGTSYRELAKKYNVSFSSLRKVAAKEQWTQLRNNVDTKRDTELVEKLGVNTAKIDKKYYHLVDMLFDRAEEVIATHPQWGPSSLKEMATAMKYLKECKGIRSDADIREQEARIAKLRNDVEKEDDTTKEIQVVFQAGPGEWDE